MSEEKLAILIPTDDWTKLDKLEGFLKTVGWTTWGHAEKIHVRPPTPPPYYVYFFHRNIVKYRARCPRIANAGEVSTNHIYPEFRQNRINYKNEFIIETIEKIKEIPVQTLRLYKNSRQTISQSPQGHAYIIDPLPVPSSCKYWLEQYWPSSSRDLSKLYLWFHEKKQHKNEAIKTGDRVLFYEVEKHPSEQWRGAKTIFASGTVLDEIIPIPIDEQLRGGKKWLFKRLVGIGYAVPPDKGITLIEVKKILSMRGWPQTGFPINDSEKFKQLENELRKKQEEHNQEVSKNNDKAKPFKNKSLISLAPSGKEFDEDSRRVALEKAMNVHCDLLNKLNLVIRSHKYDTSENQKVDLFATIDNTTWVFEVKSTNDDTFLSQVRHAIAQLYEYRFLYFNKDKPVNLCLITQTFPPRKLSWIVEHLRILGIHLCWSIPDGFESAYGEQLVFLKKPG